MSDSMKKAYDAIAKVGIDRVYAWKILPMVTKIYDDLAEAQKSAHDSREQYLELLASSEQYAKDKVAEIDTLKNHITAKNRQIDELRKGGGVLASTPTLYANALDTIEGLKTEIKELDIAHENEMDEYKERHVRDLEYINTMQKRLDAVRKAISANDDLPAQEGEEG